MFMHRRLRITSQQKESQESGTHHVVIGTCVWPDFANDRDLADASGLKQQPLCRPEFSEIAQ